jgi:hypothetical protein
MSDLRRNQASSSTGRIAAHRGGYSRTGVGHAQSLSVIRLSAWVVTLEIVTARVSGCHAAMAH